VASGRPRRACAAPRRRPHTAPRPRPASARPRRGARTAAGRLFGCWLRPVLVLLGPRGVRGTLRRRPEGGVRRAAAARRPRTRPGVRRPAGCGPFFFLLVLVLPRLAPRAPPLARTVVFAASCVDGRRGASRRACLPPPTWLPRRASWPLHPWRSPRAWARPVAPRGRCALPRRAQAVTGGADGFPTAAAGGTPAAAAAAAGRRGRRPRGCADGRL